MSAFFYWFFQFKDVGTPARAYSGHFRECGERQARLQHLTAMPSVQFHTIVREGGFQIQVQRVLQMLDCIVEVTKRQQRGPYLSSENAKKRPFIGTRESVA